MNTNLSKREKQVLKMLLAEYSQKEICDVFNLHANTVCGVRRNIMKKWGVSSMIGLVKEAIKQGYLELEDDQPVTHIETERDKADPKSYFYRYYACKD